MADNKVGNISKVPVKQSCAPFNGQERPMYQNAVYLRNGCIELHV